MKCGELTLKKCSICVSGVGLILVKQRILLTQRMQKYPVVRHSDEQNK